MRKLPLYIVTLVWCWSPLSPAAAEGGSPATFVPGGDLGTSMPPPAVYRAPVDTASYRERPRERRATIVPAELLADRNDHPKEARAKLVAYLTAGTDDPFLKVKAIHDWIASNIAYDWDSQLDPYWTKASAWADLVLRTKSAICEGYAQLFAAMCTDAHFPAAVIAGYSRAYGYSVLIADDTSAVNHVWNAVEIAGAWYLVDCTWDAGSPDQDTFRKNYSTAYLFAPPAEFIYSHFPQDHGWQLLPAPFTPEGFSALPYYRGEYFDLGLKPTPGVQLINQAGEELVLKISTPPGVILNAALLDNEAREYPNHVLTQRSGDTTAIIAKSPGYGTWVVQIFAKRRGTDSDAGEVADVVFQTTVGSPTLFPTLYRPFLDNECSLVSPLSSPLRVGQSVTVEVTLPGFVDAYINAGEEDFKLTKRSDSSVFTTTFTVPEGNELTIFGRQSPADDSYEGIVTYAVVD